jgi:NTP pyrophosphatase (non-canonical NTP hydrolase)
MNKTEELMVITMEECGELVQACSKAIRRGEMFKNSDSEVTFKEECGDVFCMLELLVENGFVTWQEIANRSEIKREKLKKWSNLLKDTHPPKSEQLPFQFPLSNYSITYNHHGYPNMDDDIDYHENEPVYIRGSAGSSSIDTTPMSEYEEKEWERLEKISKKL